MRKRQGMKTSEGYALYFIALVVPPPFDHEITRLKEYFQDRYNSSAALKSPPHITLHMPFKWKEKKEEELVKALAEFCSGRKPFGVELKNFGCFPPRVIYINVVKTPELEEFQQDLVRFCRNVLNLTNANWRNHPFNPHITLAYRDLRMEKFAEAWSEFRNKEFTTKILINTVTLLKHNGMAEKDRINSTINKSVVIKSILGS